MCNPADYGSREMRDDRAPDPAYEVVMLCTPDVPAPEPDDEELLAIIAARHPETAARYEAADRVPPETVSSGEWELASLIDFQTDAHVTVAELRRIRERWDLAGFEARFIGTRDGFRVETRRYAMAFVDPKLLAEARALGGR